MSKEFRQIVKKKQLQSVKEEKAQLTNFAEVSAKTVTVVSAGNTPLHLPLAGKKVKEVFNQLRTALNVAKSAQALVNGQEVENDYILKSGETLEFVRFAGQKGCLI